MIGFIEGLINDWGAMGVAFLMLLENVFPPIPSELVMPMAGFVAAEGGASLPLMILGGTLGSLAGATVWFVIGRAISIERLCRLARSHGRWLTVGPADIDQAQAWFDRWGRVAVLFGRLVPAIRTLISVPAGLSRMRWTTFLVFSGIGSFLWVTALTLAGYWLGSEQRLIADYLGPVGNVIVAGLIVIYVWRVVTFKARNGKPASPQAREGAAE